MFPPRAGTEKGGRASRHLGVALPALPGYRKNPGCTCPGGQEWEPVPNDQAVQQHKKSLGFRDPEEGKDL